MKIESMRQAVVELENEEFFERLSKLKPNMLVYYPGCGDDDDMDYFLPNSTVVNLDIEDQFYKRTLKDHSGKHKVKANLSKPPFRDNTFDMAYVCDLHASKKEISAIVKTIKPGGWVLLSNSDCHTYDFDDIPIDYKFLSRNRNLRSANLPFRSLEYNLFEKTEQPRGLNWREILKLIHRED